MRRRWSRVATAFAISSFVFAKASAPPQVGETPPQFTLTDLNGRQVSLSSYAGQVVSLHFFALWCEPCVDQLPTIEKASTRYGTRGYQPLLIAVAYRQDADKLRAFVKRRGLEAPVLHDAQGSVQAVYGVTELPHNVVIGRDGFVRHSADALPESFLDQIGGLVAEKTP